MLPTQSISYQQNALIAVQSQLKIVLCVLQVSWTRNR
jgi:hypothetical protein